MTAPTSITVTVDRDEYSRFESDRDTVAVTITPLGTALLNEQITVQIIKARRANDIIVGYKTLTLTSNDSQVYSVPFDLKTVVDAEETPKVRRGKYLIRVISVTTPSITTDSAVFNVSLITVDRLKKDYLHGTDQLASEVLLVHTQPIAVTGVEVTRVSKGHPQQWFSLAYGYASDEATPTPSITRTLSWCGGPSVVLSTGMTSYTLRRGTSADYIDVRVPSLAGLPTASVSEELLIENAPLTDEVIRTFINRSISWLEDSEFSIFLEPTTIITIVDATTVSFPTGTDIPVFSGADWDCVLDAVSFRPPKPGHWIDFKFPHRPLIKFTELYGQVANVRIVDIALEWVEAHGKGGYVALVPFNQDASFNFIGLGWLSTMRGPVPLPNFWNYTALVGYRKTPEVLIELIAKTTAVDILTIAGQAFRGGFSSQSVSRDGISESVSYTASATYGIYSATIEEYRKWIDANLVKLRGATRGHNMVVM